MGDKSAHSIKKGKVIIHTRVDRAVYKYKPGQFPDYSEVRVLARCRGRNAYEAVSRGLSCRSDILSERRRLAAQKWAKENKTVVKGEILESQPKIVKSVKSTTPKVVKPEITPATKVAKEVVKPNSPKVVDTVPKVTDNTVNTSKANKQIVVSALLLTMLVGIGLFCRTNALK